MARVLWTESALNDLKSIYDWISKDSPAYAERFCTRVIEAPRMLNEFPKAGRIVPEFNEERIRELIHNTYRIIYLYTSNKCSIIAVLHSSRDLLTNIEQGAWNIE